MTLSSYQIIYDPLETLIFVLVILEFIYRLKFEVFFFKNPSISIDICAYDLRIHMPSKISGFF